MAATVTALTAEPRSFSIGPIKAQLFNVSVISGDTSIAVQATNLTTAEMGILTGFVQSAAPTYSGDTVTFTIVDPVATVHGQCIVLGR